MKFRNRRAAGQALGRALVGRVDGDDVVVLGLPRGGVPVAAEVAAALDAPLDIICVRKLGHPTNPEFGLGAIGEGGVSVLDHVLMAYAEVSEDDLAPVARREQIELDRRAGLYRGGRPALPLTGRTAVIVDDGLATGVTARAAIRVARARGARRVVLAVPVAAPESELALRNEADDVVTVSLPHDFRAVGRWYDDFTPTRDAEVIAALSPRHTSLGVDAASAARSAVVIPVAGAQLKGFLDVPSNPRGLVVFVHGSGSGRLSPRNQAVSAALNRRGFATLLFDLLTEVETGDRANVFDIDLLARRLHTATEWAAHRPELRGLPIGYFGASTGAAAALVAAATTDVRIDAIVLRGGRPDLAGGAVRAVRQPVLLVVGGEDAPTLHVNIAASRDLLAPYRIEVVPGATHLFEETGALEHVARLAAEWFERHLTVTPVACAGRP
jgi:putative phosphoribosyl transferase